MTKIELVELLARLNLSQREAATLLSVNPRTFRRWLEDADQMPKTAEVALRAWDRLNRLGLAWRPDGVALGESNPEEVAEQIAKFRKHAIDLDSLLRRVASRGGPKLQWDINLDDNEATLGPMTVHFYQLVNGSFSPASYRRSDRHPDPQLDAELLEDAYACIARALSKKARTSQPTRHRSPQ